MATIKSHTDLPQSKKLAGILPIASNDFAWCIFSNGSTRLLPMDDWEVSEYAKSNVEIIPCWSLASLLDVLPVGTESHKQSDGSISYYHVEVYNNKKYFSTKRYDNLVDACYEMILKLHELNLL